MNEHDAHRASEPTVWTAVVSTPPETPYARNLPALLPHNVRKQPPNPTVEHDEIEGRHGSPYQRSPESEPRRTSYPGAAYHRIPNTREPQCLAALPTDGGERLGPTSKPHLYEPETLNVLPPAAAIQSPRPDRRQGLDRQHPNPTLLNLYPTGANAHT